MKKIPSLLPLALLAGAVSLQGQITLVSFGFTDAPVITTNTTAAMNAGVVTSSVAETVAPGLGSANFNVIRNSTTAQSQSGIANVAGSSNVGAAQIAGQNNNTYAWEQDPATSNYFQFTVNFGSVAANDINFSELVLTGRTGVQWTDTGALISYAANRISTLTVRSSLDNFAANIGAEPTRSFGNSNDAWVTTTIDLSSLSLTGSETDVTFRIYTKTTATGTNFHRTQLDSVELTGVIPEPSTYAALFGLLALGFVAWRRRRR